MQKLFSAFPGGWPGVGLLLLRALVGVTVAVQTLTYIGSEKQSLLSWLAAAGVFIIASSLMVGFMTPIAAVATALATAGLVIVTANLDQTGLDMIVLTTIIVLLGPGAFSIDARMFGRREILIPHTPRWPKS